MKYLFYVQSHIAFYLAQQVIEHLKIEREQVLYITVRNYKNAFHELHALDLSEHYEQLSAALPLKETLSVLDKLDRQINQFTHNQPFIFITHSLYAPVWQFIATHPQCKNVHLIEDGSSSYHKRIDFYEPLKHSLKEQIIDNLKKIVSSGYRSYKKRAPGFPIFSTAPKFPNTHYFGIYEDVFPYIPKERKTIFGSLYKDPAFHSPIPLNQAAYLVFDATLVEQRNLITENEYLEAIPLAIAQTPLKDYPYCYYKFHPGQRKSLQEALRKHLSSTYNAHELPPDLPFEQIITHAQDIHVIGFYSTLLFYAKRQNHQVTSLLQYLHYPSAKQYAIENFNDYFVKEIFKFT